MNIKIRNLVLGDTISEVLLLHIIVYIGEWQHGYIAAYKSFCACPTKDEETIQKHAESRRITVSEIGVECVGLLETGLLT